MNMCVFVVWFGVSICRESTKVSSSTKICGHECDFLEVEIN